MSTYLKNKISYGGISFQLSDSVQIDEREIHSYHEILYFIDGSGEFLAENMQTPLKSNTLFIIPKGSYHFYRLNGPKVFTRVKISFSDDIIKDTPIYNIMSGLCMLDNLSEPLSFLLNRLYHILQEGNTETQCFYAYSTFLTLLTELDILGINKEKYNFNPPSVYMSEVLDYISNHLSENLSINTLSKETHISASTITHSFKKEFGISVHRYITQKRLVYAQSLILAGYKPSKIYLECGYRDYSSFYKAYVSFFGHQPSVK